MPYPTSGPYRKDGTRRKPLMPRPENNHVAYACILFWKDYTETHINRFGDDGCYTLSHTRGGESIAGTQEELVELTRDPGSTLRQMPAGIARRVLRSLLASLALEVLNGQ